jgi:hypothetical protein
MPKLNRRRMILKMCGACEGTGKNINLIDPEDDSACPKCQGYGTVCAILEYVPRACICKSPDGRMLKFVGSPCKFCEGSGIYEIVCVISCVGVSLEQKT